MQTAANSDRLPQIDALRGIAVIMVVWFHAILLVTPEAVQGPWSLTMNPVDPGRAGVSLFFIVSGFVIPASLSGPRKQGAYKFLVRRFFRLYPAYWLSIPVGILSMWVLGGGVPAPSTIVANISMIEHVLGYEYILGVYWTLETELLFYAICLLFFLLRIIDRPIAFIWLMLVGAALQWGWNRTVDLALAAEQLPVDAWTPAMRIAKDLVGRDAVAASIALNSWLPAHISIMAFGALLRFWYDGKLHGRIHQAIVVLTAAFWILIVWRESAWNWYRGLWTWHWARLLLSYSLAFSLFIIFIGMAQFRWRPLIYVGTISYSLYLFHWPLIVCTKIFMDWMRLPPEFPTAELTTALGIAVSFGFSALVYAMLERPAINLGRRLTKSSLRVEKVANPAAI